MGRARGRLSARKRRRLPFRPSVTPNRPRTLVRGCPNKPSVDAFRLEAQAHVVAADAKFHLDETKGRAQGLLTRGAAHARSSRTSLSRRTIGVFATHARTDARVAALHVTSAATHVAKSLRCTVGRTILHRSASRAGLGGKTSSLGSVADAGAVAQMFRRSAHGCTGRTARRTARRTAARCSASGRTAGGRTISTGRAARRTVAARRTAVGNASAVATGVASLATFAPISLEFCVRSGRTSTDKPKDHRGKAKSFCVHVRLRSRQRMGPNLRAVLPRMKSFPAFLGEDSPGRAQVTRRRTNWCKQGW